VFLSYASEDAEAAQRICESLRAAGVEVWLDQSELRGGDAWDESIRDQIKACALFIPLISANAHARIEGYFRLEWKLAIDRSHRMAPKQPFLVPVVIDDTRQSDDAVPDRFREVQWSRLPGGHVTAAFVERVRRLLLPESSVLSGTPKPSGSDPAPASEKLVRVSSTPKTALLATVALLAVVLAYFLVDKFRSAKDSAFSGPAPPGAAVSAAPAGTSPGAFNPPPHSIAVLPFVNMSGDKEQEYFSDGLTEELLNSLVRINQLQVAARTSSFSFQGQHPDIATVAHKLNVAAVLEGSVRRSSNTVRVTAQLVNGLTGFHIWSQTYDRDVGDVLRLQTEIASAVATALQVTLLGDVATKVQSGGTRNPAAFDAYLRGTKAYSGRHAEKDLDTAIAEYSKAIEVDANYALAYMARSRATVEKENFAGLGPHDLDDAEADASRAIALAPELGAAYAALGDVQLNRYQFARADAAYKRALALAPGDVHVLQPYSGFAAILGRFDAAIDAACRSVELDPLNIDSHATLSSAFYLARRYEEANAVYQDVLALDPQYADPYQWALGYALGNLEDTRRACEKRPDNWGSQECLAIIYDKLRRRADAESQLARLKASNPRQNDWWQYAEIYAQWGNVSTALESLEKTVQNHHVGAVFVKVNPLLDPLRKEPRFEAIQRQMQFPD